MKVHGTCRWCHHARHVHNGNVDGMVRALYPNVRWLKSACSVSLCACRRYEV